MSINILNSRHCLPTPPHCQPLTQENNDAKSLVYSCQPWPCCVRLPTCECKPGKGRVGFRLYFSEHVLPIGNRDIHVTSDKSVYVSCVHVCMTACGGLHLFREFLRAPSFWRVTLRWLLVCVLLYPLYRPLTEEMSVGAHCQPAGLPVKSVLALGPL